MIQLVLGRADGQRLLILGLDKRNLDRLKAGQPIHVPLALNPALKALGLDISIAYAETQTDLLDQLRASGLPIPDVQGEPTLDKPIIVDNRS